MRIKLCVIVLFGHSSPLAEKRRSGEAEKRRSGEAENFTDPAHRVKYPVALFVALFLHADDRAYTVCRGRMCYTLSHNISIKYIIKINKRDIVMTP